MSTARYAAYGSNLDADDLARWCDETGQVVRLGDAETGAWLPDRRPAFTAFGARRHGGVLDIVPAHGAITPCAVHAVDHTTLDGLDAKESRGTLYRRLDTVALSDDLESRRVVTYEILPERRVEFVPPHEAYISVVRRGLMRHGHADCALVAAAAGDPNAGLLHEVFVYGTLMPGGCRHQVLGEHGLVSITPASVIGTLIDLGRYPGLLAARRVDDRVHGFIATVTDIAGLLRRLDRIEGFGGWADPSPLYWRRLVRATDGRLAWTYRYAGQPHHATAVRGGRWPVGGR